MSARNVARGLLLPLLLASAAEVASRSGAIDARILPPLEAIAATFWHLLAHGDLLAALVASIARDLQGFALGSLLGLAAGIALGRSRTAQLAFGGGFDFARQIALFAWVPLISTWCGIGESAKIVFVALAAFVPVALNTRRGVRDVPVALIEVGRTLCFTESQMLIRVVLPAALPSILTGIHLALIHSWLATIGANTS